MGIPLLVGVDAHRKANTVCLMDGHGREVGRRFTVDNNRPGAQVLVQSVTNAIQASGFDRIEVASEATGWYWFLIFETLSQDPILNPWPLHLYPVNPRLTAKFKESYADLDHGDAIDAFVTADRLRMGRDLPAPFRSDDTYLPIRFLTRYRYHLARNLVREKAYCLNILYLKASEHPRKDGDKPHEDQRPFSNVFGAASRAAIQAFASIEEIAALPFDELVAFIDGKRRGRFADPAENARRQDPAGRWRKRQSADFEAEDTRLTRARNRYLRYYFCEAANAVRMHDAEYAAFYERKYNEVRKHQHIRRTLRERAIVLTARKLVRLVVRLLTTNQPYQPRRPSEHRHHTSGLATARP